MFDSIEYFQGEVKEDLAKVDKVIRSQIKSDVFLITQVGEYIIGSGGKRLRPIVTMLSGKSLGYDEELLAMEAAMIEFIHTSTLLHDDVVDESELRRGRKTANNVFGNAAAVLVGDFLYTRAFQLMVKAGKMELMRVMSDATNIIAAGEVMQLINIGNTEMTKEEYLKVIYSKTAKLFEAACQIGGILAGGSEKEIEALRRYGVHMGTAFQIVDDILDYSGSPEETGKNIGDDLSEGKVTLPILYLLRHGDEKMKERTTQAIKNAEARHFEEIYGYIKASDAIPYCVKEAELEANKAVEALQDLKANKYVDTLHKLVTESVRRVS